MQRTSWSPDHLVLSRGVWLAKNDFGFRFRSGSGFAKKFLLCFTFTKLTVVWVFCRFGFYIRLLMPSFIYASTYDTRNDVLPCWIGPTNCQPKWLRTSSAEIWHEEKYLTVDPIMSEDEWDVKKTVPKTTEVGFWKTNCRNLSFRFLNFEVSSVRSGF